VRATVWGCRGSLATPGAETVRYGGNTSCLELRLEDGTLVILDAGTGLRTLGVALGGRAPCRGHLLLTHLHLDHLEGIGFFAPLWHPDTRLHVWGPPSTTQSLAARIARYLSPPLFPMSLSDVPCGITWHDVPSEPRQIGSATILAGAVAHPRPTVGYRIEENGASIAYIPDHEPALGLDLATLPPDWISGYDVAANADTLLHDAQYREDEYPNKIGWGHSSVADAVTFARKSGARRLILFHHDPLHTDDDLEGLLGRARELWNGSGEAPTLAREGMDVPLG
jgi:ribonuclease BN (tRNA processing enzyme)